ncbi:MAG: response regulator [Opitutaceae bacterium]|nr:response regulator [Opitutaceae bacterium]
MPPPFLFLVLDDDPDIRFLNRHALERAFAGCEVIECETASDALQRCSITKPDAVVTDHQLRGDNGAAFIADLRRQGHTCPIVMVTASSDPAVRAQAYAAGATRVFVPGSLDFPAYLREVLTEDAEDLEDG